MAEAHAEVELPKALVKRLIKNKLSELSGDPHKEYQVNKDALLAFSESAKVFISFIASTANDICKEKHRHTLNAEDVFQALEEMEFADMVAPLRALLKGMAMLQVQILLQHSCTARRCNKTAALGWKLLQHGCLRNCVSTCW